MTDQAHDNHILYTKKNNGVHIITFNRPDALNALSLSMMQTFASYVHHLQHDDTLRVVVIHGMGQRAFCSGGDLAELRYRTSQQEALDMITLMGEALFQLEMLPVPVIAGINGYALGGGSEIALACDMRIVDESVRIGFVQINMGLTPAWGAGQRLLRAVGYARAMQILLDGTPMNAQQLHDLQLIREITPRGQAVQSALTFADSIAQRSPSIVRGIKQLLQAGLNQPYTQALQNERELFPPLWAHSDHIEAVESFFARQEQKRTQS